MNIYLLSTERLLIELDGWSIIQQNENHGNDPYASHECLGAASDTGGRNNDGEPVYGEGCWVQKRVPAVCAYCDEQVPDSVQTLIHIHKWER